MGTNNFVEMDVKMAARHLFLVFCLSGLGMSAWADTITGRVISVHDGDTIKVLDETQTQYKIRLAGIDAPELGQAYSKASRDHLARLVAGSTVVIERYKLDKYGRVVSKVLLNDLDICLLQVRAGMAWHYKKYQSEQSAEDRKKYSDEELIAKEKAVGLWSEKQLIPPWDYRKKRN